MGIVEEVKDLVSKDQFEDALTLMTTNLLANKDNLEFLQIYGEILLETNNLEEGYNIFLQCCELDPTGEKGIEKYLYLGQIIGGRDGLNALDIAINQLTNQLNQSQQLDGSSANEIQFKHLVKKLNEALFAKIEIWMTDLCMEPEAETQCDEIIKYSLSIDNSNPETYSQLSSIRISQQQPDEAKEAITHSWELFKHKKEQLEKDHPEKSLNDNEEVKNAELVELIQPLLTLAKFSIELELYDLALEILWCVQDINDQILEIYYYESLCHLFKLKLQYSELNPHIKQEPEFDYREIDNGKIIESINPETYNDLRVSLTNGYKIINSQDDLEPQFSDSINELLNDFKGPLMSELMPPKVNYDDDDDDWEDEIEDN